MTGRKLTALTGIAGILALGEFGSALVIGLGKDPWGAGFAVVFGVFFVLAAWLLRSGRVTGGAVLSSALCLFEVIEFRGWHKHNSLDWVYQSTIAVVSLAGLITVIAVLADRFRHKAAA